MKKSLILFGARLRRAQPRLTMPGAINPWSGIRAAGRLTVPLWPWVAVILVLAVAAVAPRPAAGFSIDSSLTNGTPNDRSDDLLDAARWSDRFGSYVDNRVRGLGGGLEYSVSPEFCSRLTPRFIDSPSCQEIRDSIQQTFDIWAEDNPKLKFEDVTGRVQTELPPPFVSDPWRGFGAEIDLFAMDPRQYSKVKGFGAWTQFWYVYADPLGTNGQILPGNSLTSADIVINSQACFYLDPEFAVEGCNDFRFLLLHETGHVFGLDHPSLPGIAYFDNDFDPLDSMLVDCEAPLNGLVVSPFVNPESVMNLHQWKLDQVQMKLSNDELGALHFLYPICSGTGS